MTSCVPQKQVSEWYLLIQLQRVEKEHNNYNNSNNDNDDNDNDNNNNNKIIIMIMIMIMLTITITIAITITITITITTTITITIIIITEIALRFGARSRYLRRCYVQYVSHWGQIEVHASDTNGLFMGVSRWYLVLAQHKSRRVFS